MNGFIPGPPYFFICMKCGHVFSRHIKFGILCPRCKSIRVRPDNMITHK